MTFYPYGEEQTSTGSDQDKYATYYRDATTGLDYAVNRYYNSLAGTFLTPDPSKSSESAGTPLSWNRYSYVLGDPINANDPLGLFLSAEQCLNDPDGCLTEDWNNDSADGPGEWTCNNTGTAFGPFPQLSLPGGGCLPLLPVVDQGDTELRVPTYIEIATVGGTKGGTNKDCYTSVKNGNNYAERDVLYEVYDQYGKPMDAVYLRESLTVKKGVCPSGVPAFGNLCLGAWATDTPGTFTDQLSLNPLTSYASFSQTFYATTMPNQAGYEGVYDRRLMILNNYTTNGSSSNALTEYPSEIGINGNYNLTNGSPTRCSPYGLHP